MGTNYYLEERPPCPARGRDFDRLHIGKSSAGWCFALHVEPEISIHDLPDWEDRWAKPNAKIVDEYGRTITVDEMRATILARTWPRAPDHDSDFLRENHAEDGPLGLLRHKVQPGHCIAHGSGTYDLLIGEFS